MALSELYLAVLGIVYCIEGKVASKASVHSHDSSTKYSKTRMEVPCCIQRSQPLTPNGRGLHRCLREGLHRCIREVVSQSSMAPTEVAAPKTDTGNRNPLHTFLLSPGGEGKTDSASRLCGCVAAGTSMGTGQISSSTARPTASQPRESYRVQNRQSAAPYAQQRH
jgi:hypothetical protein